MIPGHAMPQSVMERETDNTKRVALQFIVLMGVVSLFGDVTYEGARSVTGPYLSLLGASASIVGLVAGIGGFIGYALRIVSGYLSDRTRAYWPITILGYGLILSIPLLASANLWPVAAILIILERIGKGIRSPARDTILSYATRQVGRGTGFGIHEALDQIGAILGPLIFSAVFLMGHGYRMGFNILWIPALLCLAVLLFIRRKVPSPVRLEASGPLQDIRDKKGFPGAFWSYSLFSFLSVAGLVSFQLISYHFKVQGIVPDSHIPILYAIAMGVDALVALMIGKAYDRVGLISLIVIPILTIPVSALAFSHSSGLVLIGIIVWGAVIGTHETVMRAAIADLIPLEGRGSAYGIFNTIYGGAWFFGNTVMGSLYDLSINYIIAFVVGMELLSIPILFLLKSQRGL